MTNYKKVSFLSIGLVLLAFTACNDESTDSTDQNELDVYGSAQCEDGFIAWRFPKTAASVDSEEYLATAEGSSEALLEAYDSVRIQVQSAEYKNDDNEGYSLDYTVHRFKSACDNTPSCELPSTVCRNNTDGACDVAAINVKYTCAGYNDEAGNPTVYTATTQSGAYYYGAVKLSCEQPARARIESESRVACVPRVCHGRSRRDKDMNCVIDPSLDEVVVTAEIDYPVPVYASYDAFSLNEKIVPKFKDKTFKTMPLQLGNLHEVTSRVKFANGIVPEEVKFTAWFEQEIEVRDDSRFSMAVGTKLREYRCSPFGFTVKPGDTHTVGPNGEWIFEKKVRVNFSQECSASGSYDSMLNTLAKRLGSAPSSVHAARGSSASVDTMMLHLSYDMQGASVWHKGLSIKDPVAKIADSEPECSPNPTAFFYNAEKRYYRMSEYYGQRKVATTANPIIFTDYEANRAELGATSMTVRSDLVLRPSSTFTAPVKLDLTWYINNFTLENAFSPDSEDLGWDFVSNLRADVYVLPMGLTDAERKSTKPVKIGSVPLKAPRSETSVNSRHHLVSQTGIIESAELKISNSVRDVFTKASAASSFSYIADDVAMFDLFYCVNGDLNGWKDDPTLFRPLPSDASPIYGRQAFRRDSKWWLTELTGATAAQLQNPSYTRAVSLESDKIPKYAPSTETEPWKIRGCATSKVPLTVYVDRYATAFEPISDAGVSGQGDEKKSGNDEMAGGNDADYAETCPDNNSKSVYCNNTSRSGGRSEGQGGNSMFDLISKISNTAKIAGDVAPRSAVTFSGELMGLYTLDQNSLVGDWADGKVPGSSQAITFSMSPPWDEIYDKLRGKKPGPNAEWKSGYSRERDGLGIAWTYRLLFNVGPVPVFVKFSFSIGATLSLDVEIEFAPQEEDDEYACLGGDEDCVDIETTPATYADALQDCYEKGGRLAEMSTAEEADALAEEMYDKNITEAWIGAQLAYKHETSSCEPKFNFNGWNPSVELVCKTAGKTEYRWLSTNDSIASNNGTAATVYPADAPLYVAKKEGLSTRYPNNAGVFYSRTTNKLGVAQFNGRDVNATNPVEPKKAYACAMDGAASETYLKWAVGPTFGVAAGFGLTGCTPTPDNGLCLAAEFAIAKLEIAPRYYQVFRWLYKTGASDPFGRRGMMGFSIPIELKLFAGEVKAFIQVLWWTVEWVIRDFEGITMLDENLFELELPMKEVY